MKKWKPDDLKDINPVPKKKVISIWVVIGSLLWTAAWSTVYFNAAKLVGIYEESEQGYTFHVPAFHQETLNSYWPLVALVIALEIALALYKFFKGQWTMKVAGLNTLAHIITLVVLAIIMGDSAIWNAGFIEYIQGVLNINSNLDDWAYQSIIIVFVVFAAINIFEGYRKARIPHLSR